MKQQPNLVFTNNVAGALDEAVERVAPASVFILADVNTASFVLPRLQAESHAARNATVLRVKSGEMFKNIDTLASIWKQLGDAGANRRSLLVNLGGGVITDMGAFAASTFKRGIGFINIPTTLLGAVDASVGGKTGVNFNNLKNEVGVFANADTVIVSTTYFNTLPAQQLLSGYAEMIKHGFISSRELTDRLLAYDITTYSPEVLLRMLEESVRIKSAVVEQDFNEQGVRKVLNFGHTAGHAFESLALDRRAPLAHGYAVAFGMLVALVLSRMKCGLSSADLQRYAAYVAEHYGVFAFSCDDYPRLLHFMHHDKKNYSSSLACTLLSDIGSPLVNQPVSDDDMTAALDIYRDLLHLP